MNGLFFCLLYDWEMTLHVGVARNVVRHGQDGFYLFPELFCKNLLGKTILSVNTCCGEGSHTCHEPALLIIPSCVMYSSLPVLINWCLHFYVVLKNNVGKIVSYLGHIYIRTHTYVGLLGHLVFIKIIECFGSCLCFCQKVEYNNFVRFVVLLKSSEIWCCVVEGVVSDVLEGQTAFRTLGNTHPRTWDHIPQHLNVLPKMWYILCWAHCIQLVTTLSPSKQVL